MTASTLPSLDALWMPFTANRAFKAAPRLLARAEGVHYWDVDGHRVLDGTSGLWCVNAGHARPRIVEAIAKAAASLDYAPGFNMGHPAPFELADRLAALTPAGLDRIFFTNSGSESVDTAMKIIMAYFGTRGETQRVRFVGREKGYHGVGFGGISVGGLENNRRAYARYLLPHTDAHLPTTHGLESNRFARSQPANGVELADALEALCATHGGDTIAAVFVEPMAGSAGVLVPPVGYLERLRAICDRHGILLVFDEVITGFGRLGAAFGAQRFGVTPDLMTLAKGITNGAVPMGAVFARREIYDTVVDGAPNGIEFFHGYTYSGHPLACAAGLATLDTYAEEGLFERAAELAPYWEDAVHSLRGEPHVIDIRNLGLVAGVELATRDGQVGARGMEAHIDCFQHGQLVRFTGDTIAMSPPLIIERAQIDELIDGVRATLRRLR
ncbi:MAG: aspartate aminotransferase family protein [Gemmatimonadaceae bacterium]|nr:aspartate aminotransferase family protein [Gemmatimonadaceae bacterium]